jgi:hypothetical protein
MIFTSINTALSILKRRRYIINTVLKTRAVNNHKKRSRIQILNNRRSEDVSEELDAKPVERNWCNVYGID